MNLSRRELFYTAGLAAALPLFGQSPPRGPRVAAQVYVFTQHYRRMNKSLRNNVPEMLQVHLHAGFRHLELMGDLLEGAPLETLRASRNETGIEFPVVYSGAMLFDAGQIESEIMRLSRLAGTARALGAAFLNCNPTPKPGKAEKTDAELATEAAGINRLAAALKDEGLTLLLHQHDPEMRQNARNWKFWLEHTDPATVKFCLDTHWVLRGGQDPLSLLKRCRSRLESLHLRNSRSGIWWECLDDGDLDYRPIADYLRQTQYRGLLTAELAWDPETRITRSLEDNLRRSRVYVERRFL